MHAFQTAASAFCIACICAEITTLLAGAGWAGRCIKAVAGLYILVILFRLAPQMKLELKSAAAAAPGGGRTSGSGQHPEYGDIALAGNAGTAGSGSLRRV